MRFKGTWILMLSCLGLAAFIYFYEIKGGEEREKAGEAEKRFWMIESNEIKQIELLPQDEKIVAVINNDEEWTIQAPRTLQADSDEWNRLADQAAELKFDSILEETASDPAIFGLQPARGHVTITTKNDTEYTVFIGDKNPTGNRTYAMVSNRDGIFLAPSSLSTTFDKKLDDLRNRTVLRFEQTEVQTMDIKNSKGPDIHLVKDENDRWWMEETGRVAADSPAIRGILNALSLGRIPEFFNDDPEKYSNLGIEKPWTDVSLTYGPNNAIKRLSIGSEKENLNQKRASKESTGLEDASATTIYLARDTSRPELFFVEKDLVDKLNKSLNELRDKAIASFQRWDADSISLQNANGRFSFTKEAGEWFFGEDKKKADFDVVSGILDALESDSLDLIDNPKNLSEYGLDTPTVHVIVKQGDEILTDCSFSKKTEENIFARTSSDPAVKIVEPDIYEKLSKDESDFIETEALPESALETSEE